MQCVNISDIAIIAVKYVDYHCIVTLPNAKQFVC